MNRFENHLSNKRNSRLDSFLQRHLRDYDFIRYYEKCVLESKGNFLHCHLILTDEHLLVTQNPPKSILLSIQLSRIQDIRLVADRHPVVTGLAPNVFTSQHIHILYSSAGDPSSASWPMSKASHSPSSSVAEGNDTPKGNDRPWPRNSATFRLPISILKMYGVERASTTVNDNLELNLLNSTSSVPKHATSGDESDSSESLKSTDISLATNVDSEASPQQRASSVLEQHLTSWRSKDDSDLDASVLENSKKRPNSVNVVESRTNRSRFLGRFFRRKEKEIEITDEDVALAQANFVPVSEEAHFHLYQANSVLLNELFLYWNRQLLKYTSGFEQNLRNDIAFTPIRDVSVIDEEKNVLTSVQNLVNVMRLSVRHYRRECFKVICDCYECLQVDLRVQRNCFESSKFSASLLALLELTTDSLSHSFETSKNYNYISELLSIQIVLLEVFRFLIEANAGTGVYITGEDTVSFNRKGNVNWNGVMTSIVKFTVLRMTSCTEEIDSVVTDSAKFGKFGWRSCPAAMVISLLATKCNVVSSLLHEILTLYIYTPGDNSVLAVLDDPCLINFLRQMVTQALCLLAYPTSMKMSPFQAVNLFHQVSLLWMLMDKYASSFIAAFLRNNYYEEFKYYVKAESLNVRIPDEYPIKTKIVTLCSNIRAEVMQSRITCFNSVPELLRNNLPNKSSTLLV